MTACRRSCVVCSPAPLAAWWLRGWAVAVLIVLNAAVAAPALSAPPTVTYERDVRPIFKAHCFQCHGEDGVREGELDLRLRRLIMQGGESGAAVVPGDTEDSFLLERMRSGEMPPEEIKTRPTQEEIDRVARWIAEGARTARPEPADLDPDQYITEEERNYWAFRPVRRPPVPAVRHTEQVRVPIDNFVLAKLEPLGLALSPEADRRALIRRVYFDLVGLPPTPSAIRRFIADRRPDAYERLIDELLASPRYGERWGRHWLDVAGYADSEGYTDDDPERPDAYKYRDYVIRSFNSDKPFDKFIIEQLAGDELVSQPFSALSPEDQDKLIATGFLRTAPDGTATAGAKLTVAKNDTIAATIEIVSTALLGLTVGCAQCHNHRYDPIPQSDYYALRAVFEPAFHPASWLIPAKRRVSLYRDADRKRAAEIEAQAKQVLAERAKKQAAYIAATFEKELAKLPEEVREAVRKAHDTPAAKRTAEQKKLLKEHPSVNVTASSLYLYDRKAADELKKLADQAAAIRSTKPKEEFVRALWEPLDTPPPPTFLFARGDPEQPKQAIKPHVLSVLSHVSSVSIPEDDASLPTTGRRLAYARWLTSGEHPLVARVLVNRVWLEHFGRGLVATPGDFGRLGVPPSHPELLDWLASEFVRSGWSMKQLHRTIMLSSVYRQAARRHSAGDAADRENRFYWRWSLRRLDAESLRDSLLALSGELNLKAGGPAVPVMADRVGQFVVGKENLNAGRPGPVVDMHGEQYRRTVYIQFRRSRPLSAIAAFDLPRMAPNCTARNTSTVSTQSLLMMNGQFVMHCAEGLARRAEREAGSVVQKQIEWIWWTAYGRRPDAGELQLALAYVEEQAKSFRDRPWPDKQTAKVPTPEQEALTSLCHALLSSNEFLYVD